MASTSTWMKRAVKSSEVRRKHERREKRISGKLPSAVKGSEIGVKSSAHRSKSKPHISRQMVNNRRLNSKRPSRISTRSHSTSASGKSGKHKRAHARSKKKQQSSFSAKDASDLLQSPDFLAPRSPFEEYMRGRSRVSLRPKLEGGQEWAEVVERQRQEYEAGIRRKQQRLVEKKIEFQKALDGQRKQNEEVRLLLVKEKESDAKKLEIELESWKKEEAEKKKVSEEQYMENRRFITAQIKEVRDAKRREMQRARYWDKRDAEILERVLAEDVVKREQAKRAHIAESRRMMEENERFERQKEAELERKRIAEYDKLTRYQHEQDEKERQTKEAEAERMRQIQQRETIALQREQNIQEKAREDELKAERDRMAVEKRLKAKEDLKRQRHEEFEDRIRKSRAEQLEMKRLQAQKEEDEQRKYAREMHLSTTRAMQKEKQKQDNRRKVNGEYARFLESQMSEENRRKRQNPDHMSALELKMNKALLSNRDD
eukprot:440720_1